MLYTLEPYIWSMALHGLEPGVSPQTELGMSHKQTKIQMRSWVSCFACFELEFQVMYGYWFLISYCNTGVQGPSLDPCVPKPLGSQPLTLHTWLYWFQKIFKQHLSQPYLKLGSELSTPTWSFWKWLNIGWSHEPTLHPSPAHNPGPLHNKWFSLGIWKVVKFQG